MCDGVSSWRTRGAWCGSRRRRRGDGGRYSWSAGCRGGRRRCRSRRCSRSIRRRRRGLGSCCGGTSGSRLIAYSYSVLSYDVGVSSLQTHNGIPFAASRQIEFEVVGYGNILYTGAICTRIGFTVSVQVPRIRGIADDVRSVIIDLQVNGDTAVHIHGEPVPPEAVIGKGLSRRIRIKPGASGRSRRRSLRRSTSRCSCGRRGNSRRGCG